MGDLSGVPFEPDRWLVEGDTVTVGDLTLDVYETPGHTPGHVIFHHPPSKLALVGDVLFQGSVGRTDFPRCSHQAADRIDRHQAVAAGRRHDVHSRARRPRALRARAAVQSVRRRRRAGVQRRASGGGTSQPDRDVPAPRTVCARRAVMTTAQRSRSRQQQQQEASTEDADHPCPLQPVHAERMQQRAIRNAIATAHSHVEVPVVNSIAQHQQDDERRIFDIIGLRAHPAHQRLVAAVADDRPFRSRAHRPVRSRSHRAMIAAPPGGQRSVMGKVMACMRLLPRAIAPRGLPIPTLACNAGQNRYRRNASRPLVLAADAAAIDDLKRASYTRTSTRFAEMAVPKRKTTPSKRGMRRSHDSLTVALSRNARTAAS